LQHCLGDVVLGLDDHGFPRSRGKSSKS
jgi:hypothetical protein